VNQTLANAGLDKTPVTTPNAVRSHVHADVKTDVKPAASDIAPHLGVG